MPILQPDSFDSRILNRCRSSIPERRTRSLPTFAEEPAAVRALLPWIAGPAWSLAIGSALGWFGGFWGVTVLALGISVGVRRFLVWFADGPREREVGRSVRAALGVSMVPFGLWVGRSIGRGTLADGLIESTLPLTALASLLVGFARFRRSIRADWLIDLIAAAGGSSVALGALAWWVAGLGAETAAWAREWGWIGSSLAVIVCLGILGTARDLIDVRLGWQRFVYLAQWPLPLIALGWGPGPGLFVCLLAWWDLGRIGGRTAGGRVVFSGTTDLLSLPAWSALLVLVPGAFASGPGLSLSALALLSRFVMGWLASGPYVAFLMVLLPDPAPGSLALEFVIPALLTVGLGRLLVRPIGWLWAWGGWVSWLVVLEPSVGLAFAIGTAPAALGIIRLSYRYEPRPLAIAMVTASAAFALLAFGQGPIATLRAYLLEWGGALRAGASSTAVGGSSWVGLPWPSAVWIGTLPLLGRLSFREWRSETPGRLTAGLVLMLGTMGVLLALVPWTTGLIDGGDGWSRSAWLSQLVCVGLLPTILAAPGATTRGRTSAVVGSLAPAILAGALASGALGR